MSNLLKTFPTPIHLGGKSRVRTPQLAGALDGMDKAGMIGIAQALGQGWKRHWQCLAHGRDARLLAIGPNPEGQTKPRPCNRPLMRAL
jgi:hypothetical protein